MNIPVKDIVVTASGAVLVAAVLWLAANMVFASDLKQVEKDIETARTEVTGEVNEVKQIVLRRELRDISRDLRMLDAQADLSPAESSYRAQLETDLDVAQTQMDEILDDD